MHNTNFMRFSFPHDLPFDIRIMSLLYQSHLHIIKITFVKLEFICWIRSLIIANTILFYFWGLYTNPTTYVVYDIFIWLWSNDYLRLVASFAHHFFAPNDLFLCCPLSHESLTFPFVLTSSFTINFTLFIIRPIFEATADVICKWPLIDVFLNHLFVHQMTLWQSVHTTLHINS